MTKKQKRLIIGGLFLVFIYLERGILSPFLLAVIVAYLLNPLVNIIHRRLKTPRPVSVLIVYLVFVATLGLVFFSLASRLFDELSEFRYESVSLLPEVQRQLASYPAWAQTLIDESVKSLQSVALSTPSKILPFFTGAVSQFINLILFLATTFYLLKDSGKISESIKRVLLELTSPDLEEVFEKITHSFALFLRGQLFLVALMSSLTFVALSIMGVKYALILGIFTGLAEIIPIIGPIVATAVATVVALVDGNQMYGLDPLGQGVLVVSVYFMLRQLEDVAVIPAVMGKITKVHPLLVMMAIIAGGHLAGFWGLLLAVPVLSVAKILVEYYW